MAFANTPSSPRPSGPLRGLLRGLLTNSYSKLVAYNVLRTELTGDLAARPAT